MLAVFDVDGTLIRGDSLFIAAINSQSLLGTIISFFYFLPSFILWRLKFISDESIKEKFINV